MDGLGWHDEILMMAATSEIQNETNDEEFYTLHHGHEPVLTVMLCYAIGEAGAFSL